MKGLISKNKFPFRPRDFQQAESGTFVLLACPGRQFRHGAGRASSQADLSIQDGLLATFQADLSVQDDLLATLQADLSVQDTLLATLQADLSVQDALLATLQTDLSAQDALLATSQVDLPIQGPHTNRICVRNS